MSSINHCDSIRDLDAMMKADPRSSSFIQVNDLGQSRRRTAEDHLAEILPFVLGVAVPEEVRVNFETARNLYVYAWFVYRFHAVAEQYALGTLEFALRARLEAKADASMSPGKLKVSGLSNLLREARQLGLLESSKLQLRTRWAHARARSRTELEQIEEMNRLGLTMMQVDNSGVRPTEEDLQVDWLSVFIDGLPAVRNEYAHGSKMLHPTVLHTFEIICELINQLFPTQADSDSP